MTEDQQRRIGRWKRHIPFYYLARHYRHLLRPKEVEYGLLSRNLDRYEAFVDVGANLGIYTYLFSQSRAEVYAFEPNPYLCEYLSAILNRRVHIHNMAASSLRSSVILYIPQGQLSSGRSSVERSTAFNYSQNLDEYTVEAGRLDEVLDVAGFTSVFIKIDVEGHEKSVVEGCSGLLTSSARVDLMIEIDADHNPGWRDVFKLLYGNGYKGYYFDRIVRKIDPSVLESGLDVRRIESDGGKVDTFLFSKGDLERLLI